MGVSLMESPHPSYPPLEMASSGCITVTNCYESKSLENRSENIVSLDELSPTGLKTALDVAHSMASTNERPGFSKIRPVSTKVPLMSPEEILASLDKPRFQ